jgi:aquaporin Z
MTMTAPALGKRLVAEFIGTFWLVLAGCSAAVIAGPAIGLLGVALAFGLAVMTMAYAIGHISGCHLNPAVSIGLCAGRRFPARDVVPYIIVQVIGAIAGAAVLFVIASGKPGFTTADGFASTGYAEHSPGGYSLAAGLVTEVVLTFMFLWIILGSADRRAPQGFAPIAIGLGLTLIILVGGTVTNLSLNPARSTGTAVFAGGWAISQLWMFWLAPIVGGGIGGMAYRLLAGHGVESPQSPLEKLAEQSEAEAARVERTTR